MKYGYYPGCSLEGISVEYDMSIRHVFEALEVSFEEMSEWICCGTLAAPSISRLLGVATPIWNIVKAGEQGYEQLITPCSACLYHFKHAAKQIDHDPRLRLDVEAAIDMPVKNAARPVHPLEILVNDSFERRIRESVQRDLSNLKVVCYYGCHISRPADVMEFGDPENPQIMERLLGWTGVKSLDWAGKVACCGAHFSMIKPGIVVDMCTKLIAWAQDAGAQAIVVACPMCHANLDTRQDEISEKLGQQINLPILYFSQVLGYAFGISPKALGFREHLVDPLPLMLEKCHNLEAVLEPLQEVVG